MSWVVAVDPGHIAGLAVFHKDSRVYEIAAIVTDRKPLPSELLRFEGAEIVCEMPQHYCRSAVRSQTLITLAYGAGYLIGQLRPSAIRLAHPREWKGQRPKEVDHAHSLEVLSVFERQVLEKDLALHTAYKRHNIMDAVGLGLWYLNRSKQ